MPSAVSSSALGLTADGEQLNLRVDEVSKRAANITGARPFRHAEPLASGPSAPATRPRKRVPRRPPALPAGPADQGPRAPRQQARTAGQFEDRAQHRRGAGQPRAGQGAASSPNCQQRSAAAPDQFRTVVQRATTSRSRSSACRDDSGSKAAGRHWRRGEVLRTRSEGVGTALRVGNETPGRAKSVTGRFVQRDRRPGRSASAATTKRASTEAAPTRRAPSQTAMTSRSGDR